MKDNSVSEQLIRLAYAEIILHHAEIDAPADFVKNIQEDIGSSEDSELIPDEPVVQQKDLPETNNTEPSSSTKEAVRLIAKVRGNKKLLATSCILLVFIIPFILLTIWSNIKYKDKILPGTYYSSIELNSEPNKALEQIKVASEEYKIKLKFNNSETIYSASDVGIQISPEDTLNSAKAQSSSIRLLFKPFALFTKRNIQTAVSIDDNKLRSFLEAQNYSDKLPEDAKIEYSSDKAKFIIIPEISGRGIDSKSLSSKLSNSARNLSTDAINLNIEDVRPVMTSQTLYQPLEQANAFISQKITITSPNKNYSPSPEAMKDWVVLTPDITNSTYQISLNQSSLNSYVDSTVKKINRKMEKKLYANIDGSEMLLQDGSPGLQVTNSDSVKSKLSSIFQSKQGGSIAIEASEEAPTTENIAASGGRWIFADLSQYRIYAYEGSTLVNSFPMSSGKASTPTPTGRYSVMSKVRVKTMTSGGNKNSKDYYSVPNIEWVAYFKSGGYAMHGVYWHNKFGIENTSHGCMGMSNTNAKWVYDFVDVGTPVIIVP